MVRNARSLALVMLAVAALGACQQGDTDEPVDMTLRVYTPPPIQVDPGQNIPIPPGGFEIACMDGQHRVEVSANNPNTAEARLQQAAEDYCASNGCSYAECRFGGINRRAPSPPDNRYHYSACVDTACHPPTDDTGNATRCDSDPDHCNPGEGPGCPECLAQFCAGRCGWTNFDGYTDDYGNPFAADCGDTCAADLGPGYSCGVSGHCVLDTTQIPSQTQECNQACSGSCGTYTCNRLGQVVTEVCGSCPDSDGHPGECAVDGDPTAGDIHAGCFYSYSQDEDPPQS